MGGPTAACRRTDRAHRSPVLEPALKRYPRPAVSERVLGHRSALALAEQIADFVAS